MSKAITVIVTLVCLAGYYVYVTNEHRHEMKEVMVNNGTESRAPNQIITDYENLLIKRQLSKQEITDSTKKIAYTLYRDSVNRVCMIDEFQVHLTSELGEVFYRYYFGEEGRTFGFKRFVNISSNTCIQDGAHLVETTEYNGQFNIIKTSINVQDELGNKLELAPCIDEFGKDYEIIPHVEAYMEGLSETITVVE